MKNKTLTQTEKKKPKTFKEFLKRLTWKDWFILNLIFHLTDYKATKKDNLKFLKEIWKSYKDE